MCLCVIDTDTHTNIYAHAYTHTYSQGSFSFQTYTWYDVNIIKARFDQLCVCSSNKHMVFGTASKTPEFDVTNHVCPRYPDVLMP